MNYDHDELGVGNPRHPANQIEYSEDLPEGIEQAKKYFDETDDISYLEEEIDNVVQTLVKAQEEITQSVLELRKLGLDDLANKLCQLREKLQKL